MKEYYELTILTEKDELETIREFLNSHHLEGYKLTDDGEKTLAYSIQGCEKAHYYFVNWLLLSDSQARQIENDLYANCWSLRHLLLRENRK